MKHAARRIADSQRELLLREAHLHLTSGRHTTASLARTLGVSSATASRIVQALRSRGHDIVSMKEGSRWYFAVKDDEDPAWTRDPLLKGRGFIRGVRWPRGKLNEIIDGALYGRRS